MRAVNLVGESGWTNSNTVEAPPPPPELTASGVATSTATLTISNHSGDWHYKTTVGPHATCQGPVSGTSVNLAGLTPGSSYTYTAYSDSSCGDALATETFTANRLSVSVGNLGETASPFGCKVNSAYWCALAFTTGTSTHGYTLTGVTAKFKDKEDPVDNIELGNIVVSLYADNSGVPDSYKDALATLSGSNPDTAGDYAYTCSGSGCALATSTTYFIQFHATSGSGTNNIYQLVDTSSDNETQTGNGWSLADKTDYAEPAGSITRWVSEYDEAILLNLSVTVTPPPPPELTAGGVATSTATLTISNHGGNWHYKATTGPHTTCQGPVSGNSVNLAGLTPGASYTYSAYKDSSCGNLLATETFTANRLTVSVGNLDKPIYQYSCVLNANAWCAVGFTTGTSTHGYTLTDVTAKFATSSDQNNNLGDIVVSLHADNSGVPASATLATLSGDNPGHPGRLRLRLLRLRLRPRDQRHLLHPVQGDSRNRRHHRIL